MMPPEMMGEELPPEENDEELMAELMEAAQAGDDAEGEGFFAEVPGAESEAPQAEGGMGDVSPDQLQALLEMLKGEGGGMGGLGV